MLITVSTELGFDSKTGIVAVSPSLTITSPIVKIGRGSLSVIVTIPVSLELDVLLEVTVPLTVKVSVGSSIKSFTDGIETVVVVSPAGIVIVVVSEI